MLQGNNLKAGDGKLGIIGPQAYLRTAQKLIVGRLEDAAAIDEKAQGIAFGLEAVGMGTLSGVVRCAG